MSEAPPYTPLRGLIIRSVAWRSGSQVVAQLATWATTFLVLRLLSPADYGRYAMTASVTTLLSMLSGASFANGLVHQKDLARDDLRRMFGLLILLNGAIAGAQFLIAPSIAAYYRQPVVADLLRGQCLLYAANPLLALATAKLARDLGFRAQALANFAAALAGAGVSLGGALGGWGVWTLVAAPIAMAWVRAAGMALAARLWVLPSFRLAGIGSAGRFGAAIVASQLIWFVQTQADVFIGGRVFPPALLGLYTTAVFLTQMLTAKFIPPINDVAFSAYARLRHAETGGRAGIAAAFLRSVSLVMLVALPFYIGMALTASPLVAVVLGPHWLGAVPLVRLLALAMPFVALQILFSPVTNALGRPGLAVAGAACGAAIMPACFLVGAQWGIAGLAAAWIVGFPLLAFVTARFSARVIGITLADIADAVRPPAAASGAMAVVLALAEPYLRSQPPLPHLVALVALGAPAYLGAVLLICPRLLKLDMARAAIGRAPA